MSLPPEQERVHQRCFHLSRVFVPFDLADTESSVVRRFEAQVARFHDRVAVRDESGSITYKELNARANRLARLLYQRAHASGQVGLLIEQGIPMITAMLAVLKTGRLFLALDPDYPAERIRYMLSDSKVSCLVTESRHLAQAEQFGAGGVQVVNVDALPENLSDENFSFDISPNTPAYLVYTSGSTGKPKGVIHTHRTLLHNVRNYTNLVHVGCEDRLTCFHSFSFSTAIMDVFLALLNGASSHPWNFRARGFNGLADWIDQVGITSFCWIPTPFRQFAGTVQAGRHFASVRILMLGSESVTVNDVTACRHLFHGECIFMNRLGATETGNYRTYFVDDKKEIAGARIPARYAVPETEVLLLDESGKVMAQPDEVGVIAVHTPSLSPGYWERPDVTEKAFITDPRGGSRRFYVTGDLGRLAADGCLEFIGRKDAQVKIRGFRVELSEIEASLIENRCLKDAVVMFRQEVEGSGRLVAYVVAASSPAPTVVELREFLEGRLPDYMVPWAYVFLDQMPTTLSGKIDRKALPPPGAVPSPSTGAGEPRNSVEAKLTDIWRRVLKRDRIGVNDHFFEIGGDSLMAATVFVHVESIFRRRLPLSTLIANPTIAQLAVVLAGDVSDLPWSNLVTIQPKGRRPALFFAHAHMGNVIGYYHLARHLGEDQPFYAFQAQGLDGAAPALTDFSEMARRYVCQLRTIQPRGPYYLGGFCFGGALAMEMARQLADAGEEIDLVITIQGRSHDYPRYRHGIGPARKTWMRIQRRVEMEMESLREQSGSSRLAHFLSRVRRLGGILMAAGNRSVRSLLSRFNVQLPPSKAARQLAFEHAHIHAFRRHRFQPVEANVLVVRAQNQPSGIEPDPTLGWRNLVHGHLFTAEIPGNQFGMLCEPRVRLVAQTIAEHLERVGKSRKMIRNRSPRLMHSESHNRSRHAGRLQHLDRLGRSIDDVTGQKTEVKQSRDADQ